MRVAAAFAAAFFATAGLVWAGVFHGADQYAVTHWMPYAHPQPHRLVTLTWLLFPATGGPLPRQLLNLWIYPAAFVPSGLIVAWCAWRVRSPVYAVFWVVGDLVELVGKLVVSRPAFYHHGVHVTGFEHSLPSGHTIRSLLVAGALAWTWRRGRLAYAWALTVPVGLVLLGDHTPTDCVAGALFALALTASMVNKRSLTR